MAKCWLGRLIGSGEIVRNPSLKSDRDRGRHPTTLQGEVAVADQMAHLAVADPNRQAPQPHAGLCAVRLHPLGGRRPETRYERFDSDEICRLYGSGDYPLERVASRKDSKGMLDSGEQ